MGTTELLKSFFIPCIDVSIRESAVFFFYYSERYPAYEIQKAFLVQLPGNFEIIYKIIVLADYA